MTADLTLAISAAKAAGAIIRDGYNQKKIITKKGTGDYVTTIDMQAEQSIRETLGTTDYSFLGEESGETRTLSTKKWVVDPLDGTSNFIRGIPFFAVSIGLIENERELKLGVVYDPLRDECFWAQKGTGAFLNGERISVSGAKDFEDAVILVEHGRSQLAINTFVAAIKNLTPNGGAGIFRQGTTALMLCYVAKGSATAFLSCGDELYDFAAGLVIAKEARARVSDWRGHAWTRDSAYVLASAPAVWAEVTRRVRDLQVSA